MMKLKVLEFGDTRHPVKVIVTRQPLLRKLLMWRWLFFAIAITHQATPALALPSSEVGKIAQGITVVIENLSDKTDWGSGVIINRQGNLYTVLTAGHVVRMSSGSYGVVTADGNPYKLDTQSIKQLPGVDLAVVQFKSNQSYRMAQIANSDSATIGAIVYTAGFPAPGRAIQDRIFQFTSGEISARPIKSFADGYGLVYTNVTRRGMSGGPVLNQDGQLVGIHGRAETDESSSSSAVKVGLNLGIPINTFRDLAPKIGLQLDPKQQPTPTRPVVTAPTPNKTPLGNTFQPTSPPSFLSLPSRPKPIRPSLDSGPVCAGSSC
jgi:serine protease Do